MLQEDLEGATIIEPASVGASEAAEIEMQEMKPTPGLAERVGSGVAEGLSLTKPSMQTGHRIMTGKNRYARGKFVPFESRKHKRTISRLRTKFRVVN